MSVNNKYKSSVFTLLFSDPSLLYELYCALEGIDPAPGVPVTVNTLQNALFMGRINDVSFEIDGKLVVLIEHQSTINPNIPLRLLMYIARVYEKIIGGRNIYSSKRIPVARPVFFVLYNGPDPYPDFRILKLSDLFEETGTLAPAGSAMLELEVRVLNINHGRNAEIAGRCRTLAGYSAFVEKAREFERGCGDRSEAVEQAVKHCLKHDILKGFLEKHGKEIHSMLMTDWNWDDALAVRYEEGIETGREEGLEEGLEKTARNALSEGLPLEVIRKITGLDMETIETLRTE